MPCAQTQDAESLPRNVWEYSWSQLGFSSGKKIWW